MIRIRNMISFTALFLLLASVVAGKIMWNPSTTPLLKLSHPNESMYGGVAPDLLDDHRLTVIARVVNSSNQPANASVQLIGPNNDTKHECIIPHVNFRTARRISRKTVVLVLVERDESEREQYKLLLVNTNNCKYTFAHDGTLPSLPQILPMRANTSDERFMAVMRGGDACRGHDWCRLFFDPLFRNFESIDFDFRLIDPFLIPKIEAASTSNEFLFAASFTDDLGTYRARLYDLSKRTGSHYKELFTIADYRTKNGMLSFGSAWHVDASSGLAFCGRPTLSNSVHCSRFREDGTLLFNKTIDYQYQIYPFGIQVIPNGLILFNRIRDDILQATMITRDIESIECNDCSALQFNSELLGDDLLRVKNRYYSIPCMPAMHVLDVYRAKEAGDAYEVQYFCLDSRNISTGIFYI